MGCQMVTKLVCPECGHDTFEIEHWVNDRVNKIQYICTKCKLVIDDVNELVGVI